MLVKFFYLTILLFSFSQPIYAQAYEEMRDTAKSDVQKSKQDLEDIFNEILNIYQHDEIFLEKLKLSQEAWENYKNAHLEARYPFKSQDSLWHYGSIFPVCHANLLQKLIDERIAELRLWLDGLEEGDVCTGSVRIYSKTYYE